MAYAQDMFQLQQRLLAAGFSLPRYGADGMMGDETRTAIKDAKERFGLPLDGEADAALTNALVRVIEAQHTELRARLKMVQPSDRGANVSDLQQVLQRAGFNPGPADGIYGDNTAGAVKAFQKAQGLTSTGVIDVETLRLLQGPVLTTGEPVAAIAAVAGPGQPLQAVQADPVLPARAMTPAPIDRATQPYGQAGGFPDRNGRAVMRVGAKGGDVAAFKLGLQALNYLSQEECRLRPDQFDRLMQQAVRDFQKHNGLSADGEIGSESWGAMTAAIALDPSRRLIASTPVTHIGSCGEKEPKPMLSRKLTKTELQVLVQIIYGEAGNQSHVGQQAVAEVVINRMRSRDFPKTVHAVVHQVDVNGVVQFSPTIEGLAPYEAIPRGFRQRTERMLGDLVAGNIAQVTGGALFFANPDVIAKATLAWFKSLPGDEIVIADHTFYGGNKNDIADQAIITVAGDPIRVTPPDPALLRAEMAAVRVAPKAPEPVREPALMQHWREDGQPRFDVSYEGPSGPPLEVPDVRALKLNEHNI